MTRAVAALFLGALLMAAPATADEEDVNLPEAQRNALQEAALKLAGFQAADLMFEGTAMGVPDEEPVTPEPEADSTATEAADRLMDYFMEMENKFGGEDEFDTDMLGEIDTDMLDTDSLDTDKDVGVWASLKDLFDFDTDVAVEPKEEEQPQAVLDLQDVADLQMAEEGMDEDCFKKAMQEKLDQAYEAPQEEELDDFCGEKLRWCAAVTCGGDVVAENTCSKDGNSYSVVCSCGDGQASVTQTSSSSFSMGSSEDPLAGMFARRFGPAAARGEMRPMAMGRPMMMMGGRPMEEPRSLFGDALRTEDDPPMPMSLFQALGLPGFGRGPQQQRSMPMMQMQQQLFDGPFGFGERPQQVAQPMTLQSRPVSRPQPIAIQVELDEGESLEDAIQDAMLIDQVVRMITAMSPVAMMQRSLPSIFSSSQGSSLPQGVMVMEVEQEQPQPRRPTQAPRFQAATESAGPQLLGRRDDQSQMERPFFAAERAEEQRPVMRMMPHDAHAAMHAEMPRSFEAGQQHPPMPPPPVCLLFVAGVLMMLAATCCCCATAGRRTRNADAYLVEVDCDAYTPLLSEEAPVVAAYEDPLQPLAHETLKA